MSTHLIEAGLGTWDTILGKCKVLSRNHLCSVPPESLETKLLAMSPLFRVPSPESRVPFSESRVPGVFA